jgi:hypothetical protein
VTYVISVDPDDRNDLFNEFCQDTRSEKELSELQKKEENKTISADELRKLLGLRWSSPLRYLRNYHG